MNERVLSVIVPVYNTAPWLGRCLDSICAQTYRNLEILCVNDGSTDNSAEILEEYAARDSRVKVFTQENAGLSAARNTALEHATGEWVTGVDSDDYLAPDVYERAAACIGDEVDMVFFGVKKVTDDGEPLPDSSYFELPEPGKYTMTPDLAEKINSCFCSKLWRRRVLEENKLRFPHGLVHEDEALFYLAAPYVTRVAVSPAIGYNYVQRTGSIMNETSATAVYRAQRYSPVLEFACREYAQRGLLQLPQREYLVRMLAHIGGFAYWLDASEGKSKLLERYAGLFREYGVVADNYRLERMMPLRWWQRLYMQRCAGSRVYRVLGVPLFAVVFDESGIKKGVVCFLWEHIKKLFA